MDNMYAGFGDESADVLCTVSLGLEVVKRVEPAAPATSLVLAVNDKPELDRMLLLKPKVILESARELIT